MTFTPHKLAGSYTIELTPFTDERGWFGRYFCKKEFAQIGHDKEWVQCNHSFTSQQGTIRGMHYQLHPFREIKMVRCIAGSVLDVIIDLRKDSPTFLQHHAEELSAANKKMFYIPEGFAHGFQTLSDNSELLYHHSQYYEPGFEGGLRYNDPTLNINWPGEVTQISSRDQQHQLLDHQFKGL